VKDTFAVDLNGVVAVVTGASRGAGRAIAVVLGEAGATVYLTGHSVRDRRYLGAPERWKRRQRRSRSAAVLPFLCVAITGAKPTSRVFSRVFEMSRADSICS
jgi:NAD(P)-dependent dehydrogenase (short-subunit alcohol dehydrogenase family)